ncbi:MAG: hypothetical protein R3E32_27085 [Chitinophagales bacterium]
MIDFKKMTPKVSLWVLFVLLVSCQTLLFLQSCTIEEERIFKLKNKVIPLDSKVVNCCKAKEGYICLTQNKGFLCLDNNFRLWTKFVFSDYKFCMVLNQLRLNQPFKAALFGLLKITP